MESCEETLVALRRERRELESELRAMYAPCPRPHCLTSTHATALGAH